MIEVNFLSLWRRLRRRPSTLLCEHDRDDVAGASVLLSWRQLAADLMTPRGEAYAMQTAKHVEVDLVRREKRRPRVVRADMDAMAAIAESDFQEPGARSQEPGARSQNPNVRLLAELVTVLTPAEQEVLLLLREGVTNNEEIGTRRGGSRQAAAVLRDSIAAKALAIRKKLSMD